MSHNLSNSQYKNLHRWVRTKKGSPAQCTHCGKVEGRLEWANVSGKYKKDVNDFIGLCKKCHMAYDRPNFLEYFNRPRISHCKNGHEYTKENSYFCKPSARKNPLRYCKQCGRDRAKIWQRAYRARKAAI